MIYEVKEKCYVCRRRAIGYVNPEATMTAGSAPSSLQPACAVHGNFRKPPTRHEFISMRHGLKVKCAGQEVTVIHWDDLATLRATPKSKLHQQSIPLNLGDHTL